MTDDPSHLCVARWLVASGIMFAVLLVLVLSYVSTAIAATGTYLPNGTLYPRLVRLSHGPKGVNGQIVASTNGNIFLSRDDGASFTFLGKVPTREGSRERCCATLYEVPRQVGSLQAGTLLFAGSYFSGDTPAIEVYTSADGGRTWSYLSSPVVRGSSKHGLWEPEFTLAGDGALVMFWSDETDGCCSQKLVQMRTYDGVTWQDQKDTVAGLVYDDRPGMAMVSKLPSGTYFMSYEICGPALCKVYSRTSKDGWDFGAASDMGMEVRTKAGEYFEHAPANVWDPKGALVLVGQVLFKGDETVSPKNGQVLFENASADGTGPWSVIPAPVRVPEAFDNYCPNYSSALLPILNGSSILELASDYDRSKQCVSTFASGHFTKPRTRHLRFLWLR